MSGTPSTHQVVPIIILASEYADSRTDSRKKAEVVAGVENFLSVNCYVREWYRHHVGRTYILAPAKIVFSNVTAKEWLDVDRQEVVRRLREAGAWREVVESGMRSVEVVVVEEGSEIGGALV